MDNANPLGDRLEKIESRINALGAPPSLLGFGQSQLEADEISLRDLWYAVWTGKWLIASFVVVFAIGSVILALYLPNIYQSKTLLAPSEDAQGGGMSRMAGQLGGLASLAGINLASSGGTSKIAVGIEVLKSRDFITAFIERHNVLPELMAAKAWNPETKSVIFDKELYNSVEGSWVRDVEPPRQPKPSAWEAYKAFGDILSVSQDRETGFITVSVEHLSPVVAEKWLRLLIHDVNQVMRDKDVDEARRSIAFLEKQLGGTALADMRAVFYQLIEEQTKIIMLAEVRDEYVFSTIDPPVVPEEKIKPKRALICIVGVTLGGILAVMFLLVKYMVEIERRRGDDH